MNIFLTPSFQRKLKKLHPSEKSKLDQAIRVISNNPLIGPSKKGKLQSIHVYKYKSQSQLILVAYRFFKKELILEFLSFGPHENFYRDLER